VLKVIPGIFLVHEKNAHGLGVYFFLPIHNLTQSNVSKKFVRHFLTTLVPSLTLQISNIVQSSLESPTLEFSPYHLPYSRSRYLVTWQREVKLCKFSDGTRVVRKCFRNFFYTLRLVRLCMGMEKYTPNRAQEIHDFLSLNES
jgi:hypothetical protein